MTTYAYCRVSSKDQNLDRQIEAMKRVGISEKHIVSEKESGKDMFRPAWLMLKSRLKSGDTLTIKSIDRLGRNYDEILSTWRSLSDRGVGIVVLDMPMLNTATDRDLTGRLISDIVLQLLSYVAQTEREFNRQRQAEGIEAAKKRGVHFGRKAMEQPPDFCHWAQMYRNRQTTSREAAFELGISHTTFLRWVNQKGEP